MGLTDWQNRIWRYFVSKRLKPKRLELRFVSYGEGDALIRKGWQLALPEEDSNKVFGMVYVERVEKPVPL